MIDLKNIFIVFTTTEQKMFRPHIHRGLKDIAMDMDCKHTLKDSDVPKIGDFSYIGEGRYESDVTICSITNEQAKQVMTIVVAAEVMVKGWIARDIKDNIAWSPAEQEDFINDMIFIDVVDFLGITI